MSLGEPLEIKKVLVANRGEIAVRVFRTCRDLGIKTVALYSDADRDALHVKLADESYYLGPPEPLKSYLDVEKIISVAKRARVDAIHPGYGFLSQNPVFAERIIEEGFVWIGPDPETMRLVGDKLGARRLFSGKGIPVVPGTLEPVNDRDAVSIAEEIGFPVIVKPAGGGGGIGMFVANSPEKLDEYLKRAVELAKSSFGKYEVYIEKYFPLSKHIEVQIIGDKNGHILHLHERECSVQRRYQKVIEEAPSPSLDPQEKEKILKTALEAAKVAKYTNAGTFEFLFDTQSRGFFLLEVNSRIQVEHPVTELITGLDIVELQLRVASGEPLSLKQEEIVVRGHAIEARIYAEDPSAGFVPSPGKIEHLSLPSGPWIRVDNGIYEGYEVPPYYDPLLMKVVSFGLTRGQAIARLRRGLSELKISGIKHNKFLVLRVLEDRRFLDASYTTRLLEDQKFYENLQNEDPLPPLLGKSRTETVEKRKEPKTKVEKEKVNLWRVASRVRYES